MTSTRHFHPWENTYPQLMARYKSWISNRRSSRELKVLGRVRAEMDGILSDFHSMGAMLDDG